MKVNRNFIKGRMNKSVDERLLPQGEYVDAMNVRLGSTEESEIGSVENSKGNTQISTLEFAGTALSSSAKCIGAFEDGSEETIYWFVHDSNFAPSPNNILDLIVSYNTVSGVTSYHVVSMQDSANPTKSILNFSPTYLINAVNKVEDLLFFTDDYNPPRRINVTENYPVPAVGVDQITNKMINVIVQPPLAAPSYELFNQPGQENFIETRFVSFAYRYKYKNGEYSALSQFSDVAFEPEMYQIDINNYYNGGMVNYYNAARVSFNTGDDLVTGIDLCFKYADDNIVRVIEKYVKADEGWVDNTTEEIIFSNNKIYTVLPSSEILRLYDNVPRLAKAQTIMGNRLMYGNYVDGYNLINSDGNKCLQTFEASIESSDPELTEVNYLNITNGSYFTFPSSGGGNSQVIPNGKVTFDLSSLVSTIGLKMGATMSFLMDFTHYQWFGSDIPAATAPTAPFSIEWSVTLQQDYANVIDFVNSTEFQNTIGTFPTASASTACTIGVTAADVWNCAVGQPAGFNKKAGGINAANQPPTVTAFATEEIQVQFMCMQFVDAGNPLNDDAFEFFSISDASILYNATGTTKSLHSNRDYDLSIIYMDEYNRATTALPSDNNTVHTACDTSDLINKLAVELPPTMTAPAWATKYKWALQPRETLYETLYSNFYYIDSLDNSAWIQLAGENQLKVNVGDTLRVKVDSNGALNDCVDTVVLEKEAKARDFLDDGNEQQPGLYMRLKPKNYSIRTNTGLAYGGNSESATTDDAASRKADSSGENKYCYLQYPVFDNNGGVISRWDIKAGAVVNIYFKFYRANRGCKDNNACGAVLAEYDEQIIASQDYTDLHDFWVTEGINVSSNLNTAVSCPDDGGDNSIIFYSALYNVPAPGTTTWYTDLAIQGTDQIQFIQNNATNQLWLTFLGGSRYCGGIDKRWSTVECRISIENSNNMLVFESVPTEANPDIYYIGSQTFDITNGNHQCNVTNQDIATGTTGKSLLSFFDCYAFGNGVESYKINDSITGHYFLLGQQTTAVSAQDYKEANRYADITYSGVYNNESNVNRLNEFNLGLLNFKACEEEFGEIQVLSARETDVLTLQEDKISYVLASKNLLSDSSGGGAITSIPEVLGTQISRIEDFGISENPESFVRWGENIYFTDAKRGAVLNLIGGGKSQNLVVISEMGMRSWFRDLFIDSFNTQKLGGYDPYMDEYVLSSNDTKIPSIEPCVDCGRTNSYPIKTGETIKFCVELGSDVGNFDIDYRPAGSMESFEVSVLYNAATTTTGVINPPVAGTLTVSKGDASVETAEVTITGTGPGTGLLYVTVKCVGATEITVIPVCITSSSQATKQIHNNFFFGQGSYLSPSTSRAVTFANGVDNVVSDYTTITAPQGSGSIPPNSSTVYIQCDKIAPDNFTFDASKHKLKWWRTNTLYGTSAADINTILTNSTALVTTTPTSTIRQGTFALPNTTDQYLYLVYDYRDVVSIPLCYSNTSALDACCDCATCVNCKSFSGTVFGTTLALACAAARTQTYYFEGLGTEPQVGDFIYTEANCSRKTTTQGWLGINAVNGDAIFVNSSGQVTVKTSCT